MKFSAWIDYPSFSIAIQTNEGAFRCVKFVDKKIVRGAEKFFESIPELEAFLYALPYPPLEQIIKVLSDLKDD